MPVAPLSRFPVTLDKIAKSFGAVRVLEELTLTVEPGEFLVLLGASGSGKPPRCALSPGLKPPPPAMSA